MLLASRGHKGIYQIGKRLYFIGVYKYLEPSKLESNNIIFSKNLATRYDYASGCIIPLQRVLSPRVFFFFRCVCHLGALD